MDMELSLLQWTMMNCIKAALPLILTCLWLPRLYKAFRDYRNLRQIPQFGALASVLKLFRMARNEAINIESFEFLCGSSRIFSKTGIFLIWLGHFPMVFVHTPQLAEIILTREESLERPPTARFITPVAIGNTLAIARPLQVWWKRRKLLNPAFHVGILERYLPVFNKHATNFVEKMKQRDFRQPVDLLQNMRTCTMNIICETAMGMNNENQEGSSAELVDAFGKILKISTQRTAQPWLHPNIIFKFSPIGRRLQKNMDILNGLIKNIIAQKKARMLCDPTTKKYIESNFVEGAKQMHITLIDLLLYQHLYGGDDRLSEEDIIGETNTFIFAGFDTCSVTLSWALYLIGTDPRVQRAIHDELDTVLNNERDRQISVSDIKNLEYLNCVLKETLRLYPPVGLVVRYIQKEMKLNGYTLPAGTICSVFAHRIHRDPQYFPKPESFIPERFLKNEGWHPYSYIPFAAGPKNCLGRRYAYFEAITVLASILRNFSVTSANTRDKVRIEWDYISTPLDPLHVFLTPRRWL